VTTRIGVIGAGAMGTAHLALLAHQVAGVRVTAVADASRERAEAVTPGLGLTDAAVLTDPLRLVEADEVDAVLVASPDDTHERLVSACLQLGKPVLCEKPLATTAAGCLRLVEQEAALGRRFVQLGYMRRFDPGYLRMKELLDTGELGVALLVHCQHRNATALPWFTSRMPLLNSAVHEIDAVRWLLDTDIAQVTVHTPRSSRYAAPDLADPRLLVMETIDQTLVDVEIFANARYGYDVRCEVVAENGTISLVPPAPTVVRSEGTDATPVAADFRVRFADAYRQQLQAWADSLRTEVPVGASAWDGYAASLVAEACVEAAETGRTVHIRPLHAPQLYRPAEKPTPATAAHTVAFPGEPRRITATQQATGLHSRITEGHTV
jgi:myo-inositol 2-dehydrogenase/D-chiro-inositol 1-dehydrogenase